MNRKLACFLTVASLALASLRAQDPGPAPNESTPGVRAIPWQKSFEEARAASSKSQKPLLIDFGAEWCGFCKKLDRETFADDAVIRLLSESFIAVKVDTDKEPELAKKYAIGGLPTLIFLGPTGEVLSRLEGFRPAETFLKEAKKPAAASVAFANIQELAQKEPQDLAAQRAYARALSATGNFAAAVQVLEKAQASLPREKPDPTLLLDLGEIFRAAGKKAEARVAYGQLVALTPEVGGEARDRAHVPLATILLELKDAPAAIAVLDEFLKDERRPGKDRIEALFLRGYVHAQRKDSDKAIADLKLARDADPEGRWGQRAAEILETVQSK